MSDKLFLNIFNNSHKTQIPVWFMRQAGRYLPEYRKIRGKVNNFLELCYTPKLACEVTLQPINRFGMDAAILFSDILVIPDALGANVEFKEGIGPIVEVIDNETKLSKLSINTLDSHLSPVYEAVELISNKLPSNVTLIGFSGSPWTLATYMVEGRGSKNFEKVRQLQYANPVYFKKLIDLLTEAVAHYVIKQIECGAEVIQLFDSWAGVLTEESYNSWVINPTKAIVSKVKEQYNNVPIIGFPKNAGLLYKKYILETKVDAVSVDYLLPKAYIAKELQPLAVIQGNLDPVLLASNEKLAVEETKRIISTFSGKPFIFNLGHGILPHTPIKHVESVIQSIRDSS